MAKIHELSEQLSNQIAAGEVIERPASVVKELAENAIDAKASQIDISVKDAGLSSITVSDNGSGIAAGQVVLAFQPHTTSKISDREDLFRVHSLGFRGEALASIAAVSKTTMLTATTSGIGMQVEFDGGKLVNKSTQTARQGTYVGVKDLFYNTPARLKYVKSVNTELSHIADIVNRLALAHPKIAFTLSSDGSILTKTSGSDNLLRTITEIYSIGIGRQMLPLKGENLDFKINGFISLPKLTRANRNYVSFFINGRFVKNYTLTKSLIAGYGTKLMVGRFPLAVVNLTMDPFLVDVNVHPAKQEVRLSKEDELDQLLVQSIAHAIQPQNLIPDAIDNLQKKRQPKDEQLAISLDQATQAYLQQNTSAVPPKTDGVNTSDDTVQTVAESPSATYETPIKPKLSTATQSQQNNYQVSDHDIFKDPKRLTAWDHRYQNETPPAPFPESKNAMALADGTTDSVQRFPNLNYIGQIHGTYLIAESKDGFYLVDQHAAQERVNYEKYRQEIGQVSNDQQNLLVPVILTYNSADYLAIKNRLDVLRSVGLQLEPFGQNSFVVHTHPTWFQKGQEEDTIKEMIDYVLADKQMTVAKFREKTAIMMSCKRAIKANHHLDSLEAKALLVKLAQAHNPFNCPHGRPVLVHFTKTDMEHMFKRIQDPHQSKRMG